MKRPLIWAVSALSAGLVLSACQDATEPVAPTYGAAQEWVRSSFFVDQVLFVECLGEEVRAFGEVPFQYHEVTSGSGNLSYHLQLRPVTPNTPQFFLQGRSSGRLYQYKSGGPINESFHLGPGEVFTFVSNETYVAEDGDRLKGKVRIHLTVNANGELTVSKVEVGDFQCLEK